VLSGLRWAWKPAGRSSEVGRRSTFAGSGWSRTFKLKMIATAEMCRVLSGHENQDRGVRNGECASGGASRNGVP
jgi:hypothetical protein